MQIIFYTADFSCHLQHCSSHQYADDLQIYLPFTQSDVELASRQINGHLKTICELSEAHGLILNSAKTQMLIFGTKRDIIAGGDDVNIAIDGQQIAPSEVAKNLGILFDVNLRFEQHISVLIRKSYSKLQRLNRYKDIFSVGAKLRLTDSLILSRLAFGDVVFWPALTVKNRSSLQRLQNACLRYSYGLRKYDHITPTFLGSPWLYLEERFTVHLATLIFKTLKFKEPKYLYDKLIRGRDVHQRATRHRDLLSIPRYRTAIFQRS